jgi:uncharacterized protein (DUF924 family)
MDTVAATDVLDFWFLPPGHFQHGHYRLEWVRATPDFDEELHRRFGAAVDAALAAGFAEWEATAAGALARILLLDAFPRRLFADTHRAFAGDGQALAAARRLLASGGDRELPPLQRWFAYLPFEHAESAAVQEESLALFRALHAEGGKPLCSALDYAERHQQVIARFGRFPQRNAILGRESTAEEIEALQQPGFFF